VNAETVGRTVQWARKRAGMTQQDLALATGMPQPSIARIEAGTVVPRTATLIALLEATGYQLSVEPIGPPVDRESIRRQLAMDVPRRTRKALGSMSSPVLRRLRRFAVPFVLIGELAEVAHGSPLKVGGAIEVCVATTDVAQDRLNRAFDYPAAKEGSLRLLTQTDASDAYDVLARNAVNMHVEAGILVPVAAIEDLVRSRRVGRTQKDLEAARVLGAIIEESRPGRRGAAPRGPSAPGVRDR
jgi:transcriptional regulator with XRE-family HTH domain